VATTSSCSLLLIYRPRKDERLSWPSWLTYSGRFTHTSGHPSAVGRAQDSERRRSKTNVLPLSHGTNIISYLAINSSGTRSASGSRVQDLAGAVVITRLRSTVLYLTVLPSIVLLTHKHKYILFFTDTVGLILCVFRSMMKKDHRGPNYQIAHFHKYIGYMNNIA